MEKVPITKTPSERRQETLDESLTEERSKAPSANSLKSIQNAILPGITAKKKYVPHWYQYDDIGCQIFDKITMKNPHYHIYRAEESILKEYAEEMAAMFGKEPEVVVGELGAGNSTKLSFLIEALLKHQKKVEFIPVDVAEAYMEESAKSMQEKYSSNFIVKPFVGDYSEGIRFLKGCSKSMIFMMLGNSFSNIPLQDMIPFLKNAKNCMKVEDCFLIGIDLTQDPEKMKKAYTHVETIGPFRKNILTRLNRDFDANFNLDDFEIYFNYVISEETSVYQHPQFTQGGVQCLRDHTIHLRAVVKELKMKKGDVIHHHELENASVKWNWTQFTELIEKTGFCLEKKWSDQNCSYGVGCLKIK